MQATTMPPIRIGRALPILEERVGASDAFSVIVKLVGEVCNIDCSYCYERRKPYEGSRMLAPAAFARLLQHVGGRPLHVELHGGEPLLYSRRGFSEVFEMLRAYPGAVRVSMQTNGLLLDESWLRFFEVESPDLSLNVSFDGPDELNASRVDHAGRPTAPGVERTLRLLSERNWQIGVIAVVSRSSLPHAARILRYFAEFPCVRVLRFAPAFDYSVQQHAGARRRADVLASFAEVSSSTLPWAITPEEYTHFLTGAWAAWESDGLFKRFLVEPFGAFVRATTGARTSDCHFSNRKCAHILTMYPEGSFGSCDELDRREAAIAHVADADERWSLNESLVGHPVAAAAAELDQWCRKCSEREACGGGCIATRLRLGRAGLGEAYCDHRREIIGFVRSRLAEARQTRSLMTQ